MLSSGQRFVLMTHPESSLDGPVTTCFVMCAESLRSWLKFASKGEFLPPGVI